jgi:response regulator RpfG family c-di-GMP phosphodiesterase
MNLPTEQIGAITRGAFLHDVGQVPALRDVLLQPDKLLPDELAILCRCCDDFYGLLKSIPGLEDPAEIVYAYQECIDGSGYPRGLRGSQIPLGARIVSVVHTMMAAMWKTWTREFTDGVASARQEIQHRSGQQLDPQIVNTTLSMPEDIWEDLAAEARLVHWDAIS